jgi:hypothetical protein
MFIPFLLMEGEILGSKGKRWDHYGKVRHDYGKKDGNGNRGKKDRETTGCQSFFLLQIVCI